MRRLSATLIVFGFLLSMLGPSMCVLRFQMRRAYIERELCVQREVAASMRTCHGQCHLSRQLKALERESEQGFPAERIEAREVPMVACALASIDFGTSASEIGFPVFEPGLSSGYLPLMDPVPWG